MFAWTRIDRAEGRTMSWWIAGRPAIGMGHSIAVGKNLKRWNHFCSRLLWASHRHALSHHRSIALCECAQKQSAQMNRHAMKANLNIICYAVLCAMPIYTRSLLFDHVFGVFIYSANRISIYALDGYFRFVITNAISIIAPSADI